MEIGGRRLKNIETMAVESVTQSAPPPRSKRNNTFTENPKIPIAIALLIADAIFVFLIIAFVPYTKIDWDAYMSQVKGFLGGERDYNNLKGDTGPLVYPAGFLYIYSAFLYLTGGHVYPAQILFGFLYIINLAIVLLIHVKTDVLPWWALCLLSLSKRVHSIFVLRLFNDCVAMTLLHATLLFFMHRRWNLGLIVFSAAVSVKMNVLLYAPPLLLLMLKAMDIGGVLLALAGAALVQILLGLPFLVSHPLAYISGAFNLGRVFIHFWSVNFKFIPEPVFVSKGFAIFLLAAHLIALAAFAHYRWCKHEGGLLKFLHSRYVFMRMRFALLFSSSFKKHGKSSSSSIKILTKEHIVTTMFVGNFIGIVCARSLHYQFYSWYFYTLPYLLWRTRYPRLIRLILFVGVELCWNIYPSNNISSALLFCLHLIILWGLWSAPPEYPYPEKETSSQKDK
ncbi:putative dolichyl-P-Man:Man(5)GlcNAc(2)-PP-dolichol alpha-1,3-mannosyltransferase [Medicago truncatula]|uniref:dolichyl-P-Man:Man5GlcNAc2-PP-dolichol alpha-1,3-mannosyltransferase n=1 Tax=Medicago truncatula TaxID=3880 RepID=G7KRV5_MEDTR|nr:dol-P-Man:Man(5)GlcNAc(2)-PP-Dol alpha-1,3-mannosyltransferase [Medicago truncatula]AES82126.2 alpha-1,3-mannosyltransferase, putative [Medicago truncatula]RHN48939.1 putative dolichyl-P-Man:Man(5)GlcNAc(2)-PP-dolichol alpha-1,3-mannosyltransferase [Medicago truncatula]